MPTVSVKRDALFERLGQRYTDEEFDELCFEFGIELDGVVLEGDEEEEEGAATGGAAASKGKEDRAVVYKIDVPANRYDMLCLEGISTALNVFRKKMKAPVFEVVVPESPLQMTVADTVNGVRPFVVCAVLRGVSFTEESYKSFIGLQEKLHFNICRRRTLVAIGTHDLDTLEPPFTYSGEVPNSFSFVPLSQKREFRGDELMEFYNTDPSVRHIKPFVSIIEDKERYPLIRDSKGVVLSLPPIINGDHSKMSASTRNVFVECTATDVTKANIVLNTMVCMFAQYCEKPFAVEAVDVTYADGRVVRTPDLSSREVRTEMRYLNALGGINVSAVEAAELGGKMMLESVADGDEAIVSRVPPTRADILHPCDVAEDVAIAYGYNKIERRLPQTVTVGREQPVNSLTEALRFELAQDGYNECLTMALCERDELYSRMRRPDDDSAVVLANPKTRDFQVARTSLLPGLFKSLASNLDESFKAGIRLFEISDVVRKDPSTDTGAANERYLAALYSGPTAGFEIVHGLVDHIMLLLEVPRRPAPGTTADDSALPPAGRGGLRYYLLQGDDPAFFPKRCARIMVQNQDDQHSQIGTFGIVHPDVLTNFGLVEFPASVCELTLAPFVTQGSVLTDAETITDSAKAVNPYA